jgi:serine/threonine protein phosphatase PrpC
MDYLFDGVSLKNGRETNMDSLLLTARKINKTPTLLAVLCDGVGSMADGAFASIESVRLLNDWFSGLY